MCSDINSPLEHTDVGLIKATNEDSLHCKRQDYTSVSWGQVWEEIVFLCLIRRLPNIHSDAINAGFSVSASTHNG
jgi:hypothetical protein